MADAEPTKKGKDEPAVEPTTDDASGSTPTPKKSDGRAKPAKPSGKAGKKEAPKAPRRPTLEPELARLLRIRDATDLRRPKFVRTASHRYWRIGRWVSWRRPRGQQSKQRRHYGYRPVVVSIGFGSPRATRGLTPTGFRPVLVRTADALTVLDPARDAVLIARTVGTRRRLVLEEAARHKGLHVLNPIGRDREE
ncbi:MAG TPA: 50S ribosomal protein L32e [Thermoplasmata archaeon]|nr:50S ribosomal protein L32e [Thermoplasmata archaeon]